MLYVTANNHKYLHRNDFIVCFIIFIITWYHFTHSILKIIQVTPKKRYPKSDTLTVYLTLGTLLLLASKLRRAISLWIIPCELKYNIPAAASRALEICQLLSTVGVTLIYIKIKSGIVKLFLSSSIKWTKLPRDMNSVTLEISK